MSTTEEKQKDLKQDGNRSTKKSLIFLDHLLTRKAAVYQQIMRIKKNPPLVEKMEIFMYYEHLNLFYMISNYFYQQFK